MKRLLFCLALIALVYAVNAQTHEPCYVGVLELTNQQEVDDFHTLYPDCDTISGLLMITGDSITNLNGLLGIKAIFNDGLFINNAGQLTSLAGLDSLENIEWLRIYNCDLLTSLEGLGKLSRTDLLAIKENNLLTDLSGLDNLEQLGGVEVENNVALTSISDLNDNIQIGYGHINIFGNTSLTDCNAQSVCNFLSNPAGYLKIYGNGQGCDRPAQIASHCGFTMPCLTNGMYYITDQAAADSFHIDYPGCNDLKGNLIIKGADVNDISGLLGITSDSGMVMIMNTSLLNLHGLDSLRSVVYHLYIGEDYGTGNDSLTSLTGLENLTSVGIRLNITDNDKLVNLEGLNNVRTVGILDVSTNDLLTTFQGLNRLDTITKYIDISHNNSLTDLSSLLTVKAIHEFFDIRGNSSLESLYGLDNMAPDDMHYMNISDNPLLSKCDVNSVCAMLQMSSVSRTIENNAPGCESIEVVEDACLVGVKDNTDNNLILYPNPATDYIRISLPRTKPNCRITIYNSSGITVLKSQLTESNQWISVSTLNKGMYLIHISDDSEILTGRFIKI